MSGTKSQIDEEIEEFLKGITQKSELDILTQLIFKFNLRSKLQELADTFRLETSISLSIAYIDKRPIVNFNFDEHPEGVEIGDVLFICQKGYIQKRNKQDMGGQANAIFIQAKLSENDELAFKAGNEAKQSNLYHEWPVFKLKKPKVLGRFSTASDINFRYVQKTPNPGIFLKLSASQSPVFFQPHSLKKAISIDEFFKSFCGLSLGKELLASDTYANFVTDTYNSSAQKTFKRVNVFNRPQSRVDGKSFISLVLNCSGFYRFPFSGGKNNLFNAFTLLLSSLWRKLTSSIVSYEQRLWVVAIDITHYE